MQTADIRPEQAKAEYIRLLKQDRERFLDADGLPRRELSRPVDCPACGRHDHQDYDPQHEPAYRRCTQCSCVYASPRLSSEAIDALVYDSPALNFFHEHTLLATESIRREKLFRPRLDFLRERVPSGRVLELGSSVGTFLGLLEEAGYDAEGIELCRFSIEHNQTLGRSIHTRPIEHLNLEPESFDAVCAWEVFCHLQDPRRTLNAIRAALRPGGTLILTTTNVMSFEYLTLRAKHHTMNPLVFYQYYTPAALKRLLNDTYFTNVEIDTPGETDVQSVRELVEPGDSSLGQFLDHLLFDESPGADQRRSGFQHFLKTSQLSGHIRVTARKP